MRVLVVLLFLTWPALAGAAETPTPPPPEPQPSAVKSVSVVPGVDSATVTWEADEGAGIRGWAVEWRTSSGLDGAPAVARRLTGTGVRKYELTGLVPGRLYSISVFPFVRAAEGIRRTPVSGTTTVPLRVGKPGADKPAPPKNLHVAADASRVRLAWDPSEELNVAGYEILRQAPGETELKPYVRLHTAQALPMVEEIATGRRSTAGPLSAFVDAGLKEDAEYAYAVRAFTADQKTSDPSATVRITTAPFTPRPENVLFVMNTNAEGAREIGTHYCRVRGIANPIIVKVTVPVGPEISRQEFEDLIQAPVRKYLKTDPRITYVIILRGVPWRIKESPRGADARRFYGWDRASVDAELTLARVDYYSIEGRIPNPLFNKAQHLSPVDSLLGVCRLDAADDETAAALVDRAADAEKKGVEGIAFFDCRGITKGAYAPGDVSIHRAADIARKAGRLPVKVDNAWGVVDLSTLTQPIGLYYGWYAGNFQPKNKDFRFGRGAIGAHIHSYAGSAIRVDGNWVGEMLHYGATAVLGVVTEPLLDGFPMPDAFVDALFKGCNFAEAALSSYRYLSWMPMALGDPLYRPFPPKKE